MPIRLPGPVRFAAALLSMSLLPACSPAPAKEPAPPASPQGIAVVELFTSQGCSSCPAADRLLSKLAADPALAGKVFPLAFHVDYWNYIGWSDPFSSAAWSERQRRYAQIRRSNRIYTPQALVNGGEDVVGSEERAIRRAIAAALGKPAPVAIELAVEAIPGSSAVRARVTAKHASALPRGAAVVVALVQDGLSTAVGRGENGGRTLRNDAVVRALAPVFELGTAAGASGAGAVDLPLESALVGGARRADFRVVAFAQDPASWAILGAAARGL